MSRYLPTLPIRNWTSQLIPIGLRLTIVATILFLSAYIIPRTSSTLSLLAFGGIVGFGACLLFLRKPPLGLVVMVPACMIIPLDFGTGTGTSLNAGILLLVLLLGLWLLETVVNKRQISFLTSNTSLPIALFMLVAILAFVMGQLPWYPVASAPLPAQIGGLAVYVLSAGAFLLTASWIREVRWLHWMTWLFLGLGTVYILLRLVSIDGLSADDFMPQGAAYSLFWVWLVSLALAQALLNQHLWIGLRLALLALVVATFYVAYIQTGEWQSGWLPAAASAVAIILIRWWKLGFVFGLAGIFPVMRLIEQLIEVDDYSYSTRMDAWEIVLTIAQKSPILGLGPSNYYWYTPLFPIRGYAVVFNSHSQYVDLIAQTGILGLLCFLWFFIAVGWSGLQLRTLVPEGFARAYVYATLGGVVGMLVAAALGDRVLPFVYNVGLTGMRSSLLGWIFLGGLVALQQMLPKLNAAKVTA